MILLVESQSTFSVNIVLRMLLYLKDAHGIIRGVRDVPMAVLPEIEMVIEAALQHFRMI